jgi:hypothetical protein
MLISMNLVLAGIAFAKSPVGDWQTVQDIPQGWQIVVVTEFTFPCVFVRASDDELICEPLRRSRSDSGPREIHTRRDRIREIRVERRDGANMLAGSALGGGTGAGFGAIAAAGSRGSSAYAFSVLGALMGAHIGRDTHTLRGKVIYRSDVATKAQDKQPNATQVRNQASLTGQISP